MSTVIISGCSLGDTIFTLDKHVYGIEIVWNVTRIQRDADAGKFGPTVRVSMDRLPPMSELCNSNVDWERVAGMAAAKRANVPGCIVDKPALQVMTAIGGQLYRLPVDGNHRMCARRLIGMPDFECFVVPPHVERDYRVTEKIIP